MVEDASSVANKATKRRIAPAENVSEEPMIAMEGCPRQNSQSKNRGAKESERWTRNRRRKRTWEVDSVVSVPALFVRPQPTSYLGSRVRGVPWTECCSSLA